MSSSASSVTVRVLFFARARELADTPQVSLSVPLGTTPWAAFKEHVLARFPALAVLADHCVLALNQEYVVADAPERPLVNGDELAVIPPISGG